MNISSSQSTIIFCGCGVSIQYLMSTISLSKRFVDKVISIYIFFIPSFCLFWFSGQKGFQILCHFMCERWALASVMTPGPTGGPQSIIFTQENYYGPKYTFNVNIFYLKFILSLKSLRNESLCLWWELDWTDRNILNTRSPSATCIIFVC